MSSPYPTDADGKFTGVVTRNSPGANMLRPDTGQPRRHDDIQHALELVELNFEEVRNRSQAYPSAFIWQLGHFLDQIQTDMVITKEAHLALDMTIPELTDEKRKLENVLRVKLSVIQEKDLEIKHMQAEKIERIANARIREAEQRIKAVEVKMKEADLIWNDARIMDLEAEIKRLQKEIEKKDGEMAMQGEEIATKDEEITAKDEEIAAKDDEIAKQEEEIAKQEEEIAKQEEEIADLNELLGEKEAHLQAYSD